MKWFKRNSFNILVYLFCAFALALFGIISFSCKTYAYTTDNGGIQWNWQNLTYNEANSKINIKTTLYYSRWSDYVDVSYNYKLHLDDQNNIYINIFDNENLIYDSEEEVLMYNQRTVAAIYISLNSNELSLNFDYNLNYYPYNINTNFVINNNNTVALTNFYIKKINDKSIESKHYLQSNSYTRDEDDYILTSNNYISLNEHIHNSNSRLKITYEYNPDEIWNNYDNNYNNAQVLYKINLFTLNSRYSTNNIYEYLQSNNFYSTDTYSKQYYDNLQEQYNTLNNNYTQLQNQYNTLNNNYTQLQNNYEQLQNQYNDLILANNYGYWKYIDYVEFYVDNSNIFVPNTDEQNEWTINDLNTHNILKIGGYFDTFPLTMEPYQSNYNQVVSYINFKAYTPSDNFVVSFNNALGCNVVIYDNNNNVFTYTITENNSGIIDINLIREYVPNFDLYVIDMRITPNTAEQNGIYFANNDYITAYNKGYNAATNISNVEISSLDNQIDLLNTQVNNLQQSLDLLQVAYNDLNSSYQNMLNGNNFANLFFTIAETPFASFKQIWSVDFLGVNLAGFVTGILFIGVLIWVVKKIF